MHINLDIENASKGKAIEKDSFETLFKNYYPRLFGYAIRFVKNDDIARDIIQECFLKIWEKRAYISSITITAFLFTMVRNSCLNYIKHKVLMEHYEVDYLEQIDGEERLYTYDMISDPESDLLYDELKQQIEEAINLLPTRCKEVFILSRFENLKNREIAEKLQISTTAVEKHISKAITIIIEYFKAKYPDKILVSVVTWLLLS